MVTVFDCPGLPPPLILHEISNQELDGGEGLGNKKKPVKLILQFCLAKTDLLLRTFCKAIRGGSGS